jgi:hypothetical protein
MNNPKLEAVKGQIIWSDKNKNIAGIPTHNIVYLSPGEDAHTFIGAMITHSPYFGNIPMAAEHFITPDVSNGFTVCFDNSFVVNNLLLKLMDWAPFNVVGMLSEAGIKFLELNIGGTPPKFFPKNAVI